jgi:hypothetical protein
MRAPAVRPTIFHQSARRRQRSRQDAFQHQGHRFHAASATQNRSIQLAFKCDGPKPLLHTNTGTAPQPPRHLPAPWHRASDSHWRTSLSPNGSVCGIAIGERRNEVYHSNRRTVRPPTVQWSPPAAATATMAPPRQVHDGDEAPFSPARTSTPRAPPPTSDASAPLAKIRGTNLCGLETRTTAGDGRRATAFTRPAWSRSSTTRCTPILTPDDCHRENPVRSDVCGSEPHPATTP